MARHRQRRKRAPADSAQRRGPNQPPTAHINLPARQVTTEVGHIERFRRERQASQRIPTVNARRQSLTQTAERLLIKSTLRSGAFDNTDHRQPRQLYPFRPLWFHVLLNSLFKVLCNFPSRYLFAIGIVAVFSLRCGIPPTLSCTPKQLDSKTPLTDAAAIRTGLTPSLEDAFQRTSDSNNAGK